MKYTIEEITSRDVWRYNRNEKYAKELETKINAVFAGIGALICALTLQNAINDPSLVNVLIPALGGSGFCIRYRRND